MAHRLILAGDVNLMKVTNAGVPFRHMAAELHAADAVFANLECCLHLPPRRSRANEGFFADPRIGGEALRLSGIQAVGIWRQTVKLAAQRADDDGSRYSGFWL
jgi:hypothetical protein